jgi:hypothetical protein
MSRLRLHAASWFGLVAVSLQLLILNGVVAAIEGHWHKVSVGFPKRYRGIGFFRTDALVFDILFWLFFVFGAGAAIEFWCRRHGPPKVSLLAYFGIMSGICLHVYVRVEYSWAYPGPAWEVVQLELFAISYHSAPFVFGVAVVGWVKLILLAFERRSRATG